MRPRAISQSHRPQRPPIEGGIDAPAHFLTDMIGGAGAGRLQEIGRAEADQHDHGRQQQGELRADTGLTACQHIVVGLDDGNVAASVLQRLQRGDCRSGVRRHGRPARLGVLERPVPECFIDEAVEMADAAILPRFRRGSPPAHP